MNGCQPSDTITVQCAGTLPTNFSSSLSQCGSQAPFCSAPTTFQATGIAQPRYTTLMHSTRPAFLQGRRIQGQRQSWLIGGPPFQNPLQQRCKTRAHVQFATLLPFFVFGRVAPFPQSLRASPSPHCPPA